MYKAELQNIERELLESGRYDEDLVTELADLEEQEKGLDKALAELEAQEKAQKDKVAELSGSKKEIEEQESAIWRKVNDYERELVSQLENTQQVDCQIKGLNQLYKRLRQTNFINEVFHISSQD